MNLTSASGKACGTGRLRLPGWVAAWALVLGMGQAAMAEGPPVPKKILVVSTSTRNRFNGSIERAERTLERLSAQSGAFTLDFVRQPAGGQPATPKPPRELSPGAGPEERAKFEQAQKAFTDAQAAFPAAQQKFQKELKFALEKLSPDSLKNYDGVIFCYTSGDLPLPDFEGFLDWIKAGHAFIGLGSANETMVKYPAYYSMLGGTWTHFKGPQEWTEIEVINRSPEHPSNKNLPGLWRIREFNYKIPNFVLLDPEHTQETLALDKSPTDGTPGHFPLAWCRAYGQGRVFYTSLGGNFDLWDEAEANRKNPPETAGIFQAHLLGGIQWALGAKPGGL